MRSGSELIQNTALVILTICAVAITTLRLSEAHRAAPLNPREPTRVSDWRTYSEQGHLVGDRNAPVRLVVFFDYQCPASAPLSRTLDSLRNTAGRDFSVVWRNFPLKNIHPHAYAAALATE